jgi:hypothetical protein
MFIACVNYYRDVWPSCTHILKPLTDQSGLKKKAPIKWTDEMPKSIPQNAPMLLQLIPTTINGSACTLMPLTSSYAHASSKKGGWLLTSHAS